MQENSFETTIETLKKLEEKEALIVLRDKWKRYYELANLAISQLSGSPQVESRINYGAVESHKKNDTKYDASWSMSNKFLYILKRERRFMKFREAAKLIIEIEGFGDENKLTSKLTSGTRPIKEDGTIVKVKHGKSATDTFWGSPKWLDLNKKIKPEFMYNHKVVEHKSSSNTKLFEL